MLTVESALRLIAGARMGVRDAHFIARVGARSDTNLLPGRPLRP